MKAKDRRAQILKKLQFSNEALSASALAKDFSVSRQIIVGDVALLRASGQEILATPHGYIYQKEQAGMICKISCMHEAWQMEEELYAIVDQGCTVLDVIVEHPLYGELTGVLNLSSRYDVDRFISKSQSQDSMPISALTGGLHLHTLRCPDEAAFERVKCALNKLGILFA